MVPSRHGRVRMRAGHCLPSRFRAANAEGPAPHRGTGPFNWWRGQDLNLRPSGYECADAHGSWAALIGVLPDQDAL